MSEASLKLFRFQTSRPKVFLQAWVDIRLFTVRMYPHPPIRPFLKSHHSTRGIAHRIPAPFEGLELRIKDGA